MPTACPDGASRYAVLLLEVEHCRKGLSPDAPFQAEASRLLDEVLAEREAMEKLAQAAGTWTGTNGV
jgi:hypothetical protein